MDVWCLAEYNICSKGNCPFFSLTRYYGYPAVSDFCFLWFMEREYKSMCKWKSLWVFDLSIFWGTDISVSEFRPASTRIKIEIIDILKSSDGSTASDVSMKLRERGYSVNPVRCGMLLKQLIFSGNAAVERIKKPRLNIYFFVTGVRKGREYGGTWGIK